MRRQSLVRLTPRDDELKHRLHLGVRQLIEQAMDFLPRRQIFKATAQRRRSAQVDCKRVRGRSVRVHLYRRTQMEHESASRWPLYCVECKMRLAEDNDTMCGDCIVRFRDKVCVDCGESVSREHTRCRACHDLRRERIEKWQEAKDLERRADRLEEMARKNGDEVEAMRQRRNAAGFREQAAGALARRDELVPHIRVDRYGKDR